METKSATPSIALSPVTSSQIAAIGHDAATNTLAIQFKGGAIYHYNGVDANKFAAFKAAKSIGKHFGTEIRGKHSHKLIEAGKK